MFLVVLQATLSMAVPAKLPPIDSPQVALLQLSAKNDESLAAALDNLGRACVGSARRALRDDSAVVNRLVSLCRSKPKFVKKAVMDAYRCLSPARLVEVLSVQLADADSGVVAYAAEIAGRTEDSSVVPALLEALVKREQACLDSKLADPEIDACVWLTYAPGAALVGADRPLATSVAEHAAKLLGSPHPKVREVGVETLVATKLAAFAADIGRLIEREKTGAFTHPNVPALLDRFEEQRKALAKSR